MRFSKMHGCGNDYVVLDGRGMKLTERERCNLARRLCDRHFGIGADGLLIMRMGRKAPFEMEMHNPDGSRAEMCGNGIRCAGKYLVDHGWTKEKRFPVESVGNVKLLEVAERPSWARQDAGEHASEETWFRVDVGIPMLEFERDVWEQFRAGTEPYERIVEGWRVNCVSVGNPHAVVFAEETREKKEWRDAIMEAQDWERGFEETLAIRGMKNVVGKAGPLIEHAEEFPDRINAEFVKVIDRGRIAMRVWERGAGETLACGTGACAAACICMQKGLTDEEITVTLLGGKLLVSRDALTEHFFLTGPAVTVYEGETCGE